ncbi:YqaE/Pmp3 family membrane protein [Pelagibacterium xiamenense]|uniref:YqaE/Pmp3 family membrane protein n=1 Tax=Pelagibacterium xiamenense TaxID=2901140 RepID=UPI001E283698|nr:YqaE/Pmp3 family membrane protein [Pelagibacterium xiamenense]MCD7058363.1 YqaE/Pmp3 family membrane protein [Pelagibacterium xiamenense]
MSFGDFIRIVFSVLIPPLGVFLQVGFGLHFWLNILLTLLGYIPGLIHAIWIIAKKG